MPYVVQRFHRGLPSLPESKRDVDQAWYGLMRLLGDGTCPPERGISGPPVCWIAAVMVVGAYHWHWRIGHRSDIRNVVMFWNESCS